MNGITVNAADTVFTLPTAGTYLFSYSINTTAALLVSSRLLINGAASAPSTISPVLSLSNFNNTILLTVPANTTVQLQLFGLLGAATLLTGAGATLTIVRVS